MTESYRTIRKEINLTLEEFEQIQLLMRKENAEQFSPFVRQKLLDIVNNKDDIRDWFILWQSQKIEQISRDILQVATLAERGHQVTSEHLRIICNGCGSKESSYKFKLAYCLDGYDDSNAFILLMNLMFCSDGDVLEQVLRSLISFDSSRYIYLFYQFPRGIEFLKQLSNCEKNKVISRLSIDIFVKFEL